MTRKSQLFFAAATIVLAAGMLALTGAGQAGEPRRASGMGVSRHLSTHHAPGAGIHRDRRAEQTPGTINLSFGLIDYPRSSASNAFGLNRKGEIVGGYGPIPPPN